MPHSALEHVFDHPDVRGLITKRLRAFDIKMLMDSCTRFRHDRGFQKCLFFPCETPKVKDVRVCTRFFDHIFSLAGAMDLVVDDATKLP